MADQPGPATVADVSPPLPRSAPARGWWLPWAGVVLITAYAVLAAVQSLILNPLAAVPGRTLDEIHRDLAAAGESMSTEVVIGHLAAGPVTALVVAAVGRLRGWLTSTVVGIHLLLLTFGPAIYVLVGFGPGMAIGDTYWSWLGWERSPWWIPLVVVSLAAGVTGATMLIILARRSRQD